jgi:hypothetical protein
MIPRQGNRKVSTCLKFRLNCSSLRGRVQDFLTPNQHLSGFLIPQRHLAGLDRFLIPQRHLAGLDRLGRPPLREHSFCRGDPLWSPPLGHQTEPRILEAVTLRLPWIPRHGFARGAQNMFMIRVLACVCISRIACCLVSLLDVGMRVPSGIVWRPENSIRAQAVVPGNANASVAAPSVMIAAMLARTIRLRTWFLSRDRIRIAGSSTQ